MHKGEGVGKGGEWQQSKRVRNNLEIFKNVTYEKNK